MPKCVRCVRLSRCVVVSRSGLFLFSIREETSPIRLFCICPQREKWGGNGRAGVRTHSLMVLMVGHSSADRRVTRPSTTPVARCRPLMVCLSPRFFPNQQATHSLEVFSRAPEVASAGTHPIIEAFFSFEISDVFVGNHIGARSVQIERVFASAIPCYEHLLAETLAALCRTHAETQLIRRQQSFLFHARSPRSRALFLEFLLYPRESHASNVSLAQFGSVGSLWEFGIFYFSRRVS